MIAIRGRTLSGLSSPATDKENGSSSSPSKRNLVSFPTGGALNRLGLKDSLKVKAMDGSRTVSLSETDFHTNGHASDSGIIIFPRFDLGFLYFSLLWIFVSYFVAHLLC